MSRKYKWLVMCSAERAMPIAEVIARVKMPSCAKVRLDGEVLILSVPGADDEDAEVFVWLSTAPVVAAEAIEFAEEYGARRPDRDIIASYDARYEIVWNLASSEFVFDAYYTIAYRLAKAVQGITLDLVEGQFVEA